MAKSTTPHGDTLERELDAPDAEGYRAIGQPIRRKEDYRMLTGAGRFSDDFRSPGEAYAVMVRSPYPHARIKGVDGTAALALPGVLAVLCGADCLADGLQPIPHSPVPSTKFDMKLTGPGGTKVFEGPHMLLPADKVRHVGEAVAMVVAETHEQALDGAEVVEVDYEELPSIHHSEDAFAPDAPLVWDEAAGNILVDTTFGDQDATERAFAEADHIIARDFNIGRVTGVPLEPRAALGIYDEDTGRYTLYAGSGGAVRQKGEMATVLGVDRENIRVLSYDVGGNFGTRNRVYVEFGLVLWASGKLKRPVKYTATRSEAFLSDYQGRDLVTKVELAMKADGRFLGLRATNISNIGARCISLSPLAKGSALITGSYDIPAATLRALGVFTNTAPTQAYRSSGRPEVNFALERLIEIACLELGFDRIDLRRKNFIAPDAMPYRNAMDTRYDSGTYEDNMDLAMRIADWDGFAARRAEAAKRGRLLGQGLSHYVESSTGAPKERTEITVKPDGAVDVVIGTQPSGQGHETSFAQVISDLLGVPVAVINIIMGDTDVVSVGGGSHSGRSMRHAGTVMSIGATELTAKGCKIAAIVFGLDDDQVSFTEGRFRAADSNRSLDFLELAREAAGIELPKDLADGLFVVTDNEMHEQVFPNGCAVCEIEVDPETGGTEITRYSAVDDVGRCINPLIVHGQTHGGIAQGVGQALWEHCMIDPESGQPVVGSFMDYGMPRSDNLPHLDTEIVEVLSPTNPLGIKAGGEGGTTPAPAVVINAIVDALKDYGIDNLTMPATPRSVWQAIETAKLADKAISGN
jgi:carbon-monoxide dehydrogenase large subunit